MQDLWIILLIVLFGVFSLELGISTAILEIIAGVVGGNILDVTSSPWIDFMANYGILGLMFLAGLEVDKEELKKYAKRSITFASCAYFIPLISLFVLSMLIFNLDLRKSAIVAIALSTTSLALLYPVLKERGLLDLQVGHVILSSAMLIDVWSMLSLTVIFAMPDWITLLFLGILVAFMWYVPKLGKWLFSRYRENLSEIELKFLLFILLALLFFSEHVMVSEAVLAFVMGFLFSELLGEHEVVVDKLKGMVFAFFSPIFFFKAGSFMKISNFSSASILLTLILFPAAFLSKYISSKAAFNRLCKASRTLSEFVGASFNFRLTFGIVSALFGLKYGIISTETYTAIISVIILSAIFSTVILKAKEQKLKEFCQNDSNP